MSDRAKAVLAALKLQASHEAPAVRVLLDGRRLLVIKRRNGGRFPYGYRMLRGGYGPEVVVMEDEVVRLLSEDLDALTRQAEVEA